MKKTIVLTLILSSLFFQSFSQEIRFGALAGLNVSSLHTPNKHEFGNSYWSNNEVYPMLNFNINAYFAYKFKNKIGISIEPGYISKGTEIKYSMQQFLYSEDGPYTKLRKHFIYTPLFFDWYFSERFSLSIGPEFAYHLSTTVIEPYETLKYDAGDKPFQLSANIGLNFKIINHICIGIRYSHELPIYDPKYSSYDHYLQLMLRFNISKNLKYTR